MREKGWLYPTAAQVGDEFRVSMQSEGMIKNPALAAYTVSDPRFGYSAIETSTLIPIWGQPVEGLPVYARDNDGMQCVQYVPSIGLVVWQPCNLGLGHITVRDAKTHALTTQSFGQINQRSNTWYPKYKLHRLRDLLLHRTISSLAGNLKYVLIVLDGMADYRGHVANTTFRQIGDLTGYGKDTINKHLDELKKLKVIKELSRTRRKQKGIHQETLPREYEILIGYQTVEWKDQNLSLVYTNY